MGEDNTCKLKKRDSAFKNNGERNLGGEIFNRMMTKKREKSKPEIRGRTSKESCLINRREKTIVAGGKKTINKPTRGIVLRFKEVFRRKPRNDMKKKMRYRGPP